MRLWVDDHLLFDSWQDPQSVTLVKTMLMSQGYHRVYMQYYEATGSATANLSWQLARAYAYLPVVQSNPPPAMPILNAINNPTTRRASTATR